MRQAPTADPIDRLADGAARTVHPETGPTLSDRARRWSSAPRPGVLEDRRSRPDASALLAGAREVTHVFPPRRWAPFHPARPRSATTLVPPRSRGSCGRVARCRSRRFAGPRTSASTTSVIDRPTTTRWRSRNAPSPPAVTTSTDANDNSSSHIGRTATKPMRHTALTLTDSA